MTPLEKALQRHNTKSCRTCKDRVEIGGISYCQIDGKMIHPLLLNKQCYTRCPTEEQRGGREVEMNDRDEVIRELQTEVENATYPDRPRRFMFPLWLAEKVLELLKAQEPRLLTLDEIHDSMVVYLEAGTKFLKIVDDDGVVLAIGGSERTGAKCFITVWDVGVAAKDDEYNVTWRAWSQRPTREQWEGTAWN